MSAISAPMTTSDVGQNSTAAAKGVVLKTKEIPLPAMIKVLMIMSVQVLIALVCIFRIA
jgi:hypothetical protein